MPRCEQRAECGPAEIRSSQVFTLLDVVASTSLQAGPLVSGFLITASADTETSPTDPYRAFVLVATAATISAIVWSTKISSRRAVLGDTRPC